MYTRTNFKSGAELKRAIADGKRITVFQPNALSASCNPPQNGEVDLEGPHYPAPHSWYLKGTLKDGVLIKVR